MSIKPIDLQVMLPRTNEVTKIHSEEQQRSQIQQQGQANLTKQKVDDSLRQVHSQDKAQEAKIREKQEKERQEKRKEKKKDKGSEDSNNQATTIDIRL